jgi:Repeat of unknown function (DUF346)
MPENEADMYRTGAYTYPQRCCYGMMVLGTRRAAEKATPGGRWWGLPGLPVQGLGRVAVAMFAVILFAAAVVFGVWATVTGSSAVFGRLTALAGVFSLVLAAAIAAVSMLVWARRPAGTQLPTPGVAVAAEPHDRIQQHVFYRGIDDNIHHVWWDPRHRFATDQWPNDVKLAGDPATLLTEGSQLHVFYPGIDDNIHHVRWDPQDGFVAEQLPNDIKVAGNLATHVTGAQQHVFYRGIDDNIHHVRWDPQDGFVAEQLPNDIKAAGDPVTHVAGAQQHVFYRGIDDNIHHVRWDPQDGFVAGQWPNEIKLAGDPATLLTEGSQLHVFYPGIDDNIQHIWWDPQDGFTTDQWPNDIQVAGDLATLLGTNFARHRRLLPMPIFRADARVATP